MEMSLSILLNFLGTAAFLPKYLEYQFNLTPGQAAMVVGCLSVPAGAGGTLMGGYLLKRLSLDRTGAIKLYLFCQAIIIPLYFGFLIHCPTADIQVEFKIKNIMLVGSCKARISIMPILYKLEKMVIL